MYLIHTRDLVTDDPRPMYRNITELIEADGEAGELFLQQTAYDGFPSQHFIAIDWKTKDDIELDIADYIGQKTFNLFEKCILNLDEEVFSYTKAHSFYMACLQHTGSRR